MDISATLRTRITSTIRMLAADAVQKANSGHPGAPMGLADLTHLLWDEYLRFDPRDPNWVARDRFVLSCGHASMLQYSLLHLWGFDVSLEDLKSFRQWGSVTPGHPEVGQTAGIEVTTGPLGQGVANSVGMALAAKMLGARIRVDGEEFQPMNQRVFAVCSDGDLMEGISSEAASMAGHWQLDNLVWLYDDNKITIDGSTDLAFSEDVEARFRGFGWHVFHADGHDVDSLRMALNSAVGSANRPSLVVCRTRIGLGSPNKVDSEKSHGSPLGDDELTLTRDALNWPNDSFHIPVEVKAHFEAAARRKADERAQWQAQFDAWQARQPKAAEYFHVLWRGEVPENLAQQLVDATPKSGATRKLSAKALASAAKCIPGLVGGSADLTGSNGAAFGDTIVGSPNFIGQNFSFDARQIHYGVREHAMGAVTNGILLHGGLRPFGATFLVFSDYLRPALRLSALSHLGNIFIFTHDSIFLGEDGPTHQPVEHHWALRVMPGVTYFRPADGVETAMAWAYALREQKAPTCLSLSRQSLPAIDREPGFVPEDVWRGGYIVKSAEKPDAILVGTGSEMHICMDAAARLEHDGLSVRVVSMPSTDLFFAQDIGYRERVIPTGHTAIVTVEAGVTGPWMQITGPQGLQIGLDRFGASAPASVLAEKFGFTAESIAARVLEHIQNV